jgi:hypothetical protein
MFFSNETKGFSERRGFGLTMALSVMLLLPSGTTGLTREMESEQHYKMISSVEYAGRGQFRNQVETLFTVRKKTLPDNKVLYLLSGSNLDPNITQVSSPLEFSFVLDQNTRHLSGVGEEDMAFLARVNNESVRSLKKVTKDNVGKTWKQSINLSSLGDSLPDELRFTLTALGFNTEVFGEMIAVRALSEPFFVKAGKGSLRSKINAVYLFDSSIEEIYLSISVFEGRKDANGKKRLRHEVATYKTDAAGTSVDLKGLGPKFEKFVRKVGLSSKRVKIVKQSALPQWAQSGGLVAAQAANICVAMACEGALNPVVTVCIPAARIVAMQSRGQVSSIGAFATAETVAGSLGKSVPGIGTMKIAVAPAWTGMGLITAKTATLAAGATAGGLVIANNSGQGKNRSPSVP